MLAYPQVAKKSFKLIFLVAIIVRVEHTEKYALSETARADEEEVTWLFLQLWQKHSLIDIILVLLYDRLKV